MRCPACGARNAETAEWCTQCYVRLDGASSGAPAAAPDGPPAAPTTTPPATHEVTPGPATGPAPVTPEVPAGSGPGPGAEATSDGRFRRTPEGIDWRCELCETWNPLERTTCSSCRSPFARTIAPTAEVELPDVDETTAVIVSMLLPGAGHLMLKRTGAGILRMILYVSWLVGGLLLLRAAASSSQSLVPAAPLLLGALAVLVASAVEVQQMTTDNDLTILTPRVTLWLVVGVLGMLMMSFLGAALTASR